MIRFLQSLFSRESDPAMLLAMQQPLAARDPAWPRESRRFLVGKRCAGCGTTKCLETHHIWPVHLFPEREMEQRWWLPLCGLDANRCHFIHGHSCNFSAFNPHVVDDCNRLQLRIATRRTTRDAA